MRYGARALAAGLATVLVGGCTAVPDLFPAAGGPPGTGGSAQPAAPARFAGQDVEWAPCHTGDDLDAAVEEGGERDWLSALECGTVAVPLDYADSGGRTIDLHLVRAAATGDGERIGSLVINPGGPGVTGSEALFWETLSPRVRASFDLVSFDPRGVGRSEGLECGNWDAIDRAMVTMAGTEPADLVPEQLEPLEEAAREYADDCADTAGEDFLRTIGTVNVVRDLDIIRDALGDDELSFLGFSYGTYVGALYAETFPHHTRALVLDGAVETDHSNAESAYEQALGFQASWEHFVEYCVSDLTECPFDGAEGAEAAMDDVLARLDADPPMVGEQPVGSADFSWMVMMALYDEFLWEDIAQAVLAVRDGDDEAIDTWFPDLYDYAFETAGTSVPRSVDAAPMDDTAAMTAINCADRDDPEDIEAYREATVREAEAAPHFGGGVWAVVPCAYWTETEEAPTGFTAPDAPPVVVVGTLGDPATPYAWAQELAEQLETATLVTYEGGGHTIYGYGVSACVDDAVDAYLIDGTPPEEALSCPGEL
ncbi:alpha/beta hydrolase [Nocardiopsis sp. YSL2]|uniref:alpha/beta hydrolase n=1 Tax=Nocardiopsis sp. YSL2 TaxID=2939492 RepID=UPI0026F4350B|nr:alpha/beta hydrolase [Nocardiopsis sp. YSL2]